MFKFSGLYSRIQPMKLAEQSTDETNQLTDTIIEKIKITVHVKSTIPLFLTRQTGQMVETVYR